MLQVPQQTKGGVSFYRYYEFIINPDSALFYAKQNAKELHIPFSSFSTEQFEAIVELVTDEMEVLLFSGFDKRNNEDPVPSFKGIKKVFFR